MIICHCHRVTDREIKRVIARGASTLQAVGDACGAGSCCGGCSSEIATMLFRQRRVLPLVSDLLGNDLEVAS
jgi:bacterioferritin-associated ferredoxin